MRQSFRWFGPDDSVKLSYIKQAGASHVVTALHHINNGDIWTVNEIKQRKKVGTRKVLRLPNDSSVFSVKLLAR